MKRLHPGEFLVVGFEGCSLAPSIRKCVLEWKVGGVILFGRNIRNPQQVSELCSSLQELRSRVSDLPLLIAVDQEGGAVARFREGVTLFPGNMALGVGGTEEDAYRQGRITGRGLRELGVNMNLAPVLDLYTPPGNPALGIRSLGSEPSRVASLGSALIRGMQEEGIVATAKHFPGKGRAGVDSHRAMPVIRAPAPDLESRDLIPFRAAVSSGVKAVMTSHAAYPALNRGNILPATLSYGILTGWLRKKLRFENLVITDDIGMGAIRKHFSPPPAAIEALKAGADMILLCHCRISREQTFAALRKQLLDDDKLARRARESLKRISRVKSALTSSRPQIRAHLEREDPLTLEIARKAVTVIRDRRRRLPLKRGERTVIVWMRPERTVEVEGHLESGRGLGRYLEVEGISAETIPVPLSPSLKEIENCLRRTQESECVIITSYDAYRYGSQSGLINELLKRHPESVLSILKDPRDAGLFPGAGTIIFSFGFTPSSLQALAEVISGKIKARREIGGIEGIY